VLFQTYYHIDPYRDFEPPLEPFRHVRFDDPGRACSLHLRYKYPESEEDHSYLLVQLLKDVSVVPDDVRQVLTGVDRDTDEKRKPPSDGFQTFPNSYRDFIGRLHAEMDSLATDVFNVIRWRLGVNGGPLTLDSSAESMRWHDDSHDSAPDVLYGFLNCQIPVDEIELSFPEFQDLDFNASRRGAVEELLRCESIQPLHHDLFREAWQNQRLNPRSALVLGMAALETGLKSTFCELNEALRWILEHLPSPPVDKLLREYVPQIAARNRLHGKVLRPPNNVISAIKSGIEQRNRLVHGRQDLLSCEQVTSFLLAVRDTLYLMDFYRGHQWALDHLREDVREQLTGGA
jgi:hypothetical protein